MFFNIPFINIVLLPHQFHERIVLHHIYRLPQQDVLMNMFEDGFGLVIFSRPNRFALSWLRPAKTGFHQLAKLARLLRRDTLTRPIACAIVRVKCPPKVLRAGGILAPVPVVHSILAQWSHFPAHIIPLLWSV